MGWKANYNITFFFSSKLRCIKQPRRTEQTRKTNLSKKIGVVVIEK